MRGMKACKGKTTRKAKKSSGKGRREKGDGQPVKLEDARRQLEQIVGANVAEITEAVIEEALKGKYQPAKFLFETVGLTNGLPEEQSAQEEEESLAKILLHQWKIGDGEDGPVTKDTAEEEAEELVVP